jgi:uncharacterized protein (TIGR03066 family)
MRMILSGALAVLVFNVAAADDKKVEKIDAAKLIGKWEPKSQKGRPIEFKKDGKLTVTIPGAGMDFKLDGTYAVEGNKIMIVLKTANADVKRTITVSKFTDTELTGTDDTGKEDTLVKLKDK